MHRKETPIVIEDLTTLEALFTDKNRYTIARHKETKQYYLLAEHLALPFDAQLINVNTGNFHDELCREAKCKHLASFYNPFRPSDYQAYPTEILQMTTQIPELGRAGWSFYARKQIFSMDFRFADFYVIHNQFPWLGLNITNEFGLRLSNSRFGTSFIKSDGTNCKPEVTELLKRWNEAKENSQFPDGLQKLVLKAREELKEKEAVALQQRAEKERRNSIIATIQRSQPYQNFIKYLIELATKDDKLALDKSTAFKPFIMSLTADMSADGFHRWLEDAKNFATHFAGKFAPRPGFWSKETPQETTCYQDFVSLNAAIVDILDRYQYKLPHRQPQPELMALNGYKPHK